MPIEIHTNNQVVPIDKVKPNEYNPKLDFKDNEQNKIEYEKIRDSLKVHGQLDPVIVRELEDGTFEIINGYHRYEVMKEEGNQEVEIKNLGKIDFDKALAIALSTEDTKVPIDNVELADLLNKVVTAEKPKEYWAELLPYTSELIQSKIDLINFDFTQFDESGEGADLQNLNYSFKFKDEIELSKVKDYFEQFPKEERGEALIQLLN